MKIFRLKLSLLILTLAFSTLSFSNTTDKKKEKEIISIVNFVLEKTHYNPKITERKSFSNDIYNSFLKSLDSDKLYFLKSDIEEFAHYKSIIDMQLRYKDLGFFNVVEKRYEDRQKMVFSFYDDIMSEGFDLEKEEIWTSNDDDSSEYCKNVDELKNRWRLSMKRRIVGLVYYKIKEKEEKNEKANIDSIKNEVIKREKKQYKELFEYLSELNRDDRFSLFVNAITENYDPHTTYLPPKDENQFNITISGKLEGIGAILTRKDGYIEVNEVVIGGPAWKQGELKKGDKILSVHEKDKEPTNLVGMRLDDAIQYIRGKKGTIVSLSVKDSDENIKEIKILRDVVEIDEVYAKSAIIERDGKQYGFIHLPSFYIDFNKAKTVNCAIDIKKEILALKKQNISGLIIDLRYNGGGSLPSVVEIGGYFIDKGPIVQVKSLKNLTPLEDNDSGSLWDGNLVIMVDGSSASASEILAAAMQDYNRAVIVGTEHTYGKGTVQNLVNLDDVVKSTENDLGALRVTIQKFYRVDGGSTQLKGVTPDIILPDLYTSEFGEKNLDNCLPWDKVEPLEIQKADVSYNLSKIKGNSDKRIKNNEYFQLIEKKKEWLQKEKNNNTKVNIGLNKFISDSKEYEKNKEQFKKLDDYKNSLAISYPSHDLEAIANDSTLKAKRENWHKNLNKDLQLEEVINILEDMSK